LLVAAFAMFASSGAHSAGPSSERVQGSGSTLYEIGIDGRGTRAILSEPASFSVLDLSPDRKQALVVSPRSGMYELTIADLTKGTENVLMRTPYSIDTGAWSPDGKTIAFDLANDSKCEPPHSSGCAIFELWLVGVHGEGLRMLATRAHEPSWSPDSRRLAFVGKFDAYAGTGALMIATRDGRNQHEIGGPGGRGLPQWAPHGGWIAYTTVPGTHEDVGLVRLISVDGRTIRKFGAGSELVWSPSGRKLAFTRLDRASNPKTKRPELTSVYVLDRGGRRAHRLVSSQYVSFPTWSPRGKLLAYRSAREARPIQLDLVRASGGKPREVTIGPLSRIFWSRDGRRLFFERDG